MESAPVDGIGGVVYVRDRVAIKESPAVERAKISTWSPTSFAFTSQVKWG